MRVMVVLTIDGVTETRIEGESRYLDGVEGDTLEQKGVGFWLSEWRFDGSRGARQKGRVFCPWGSVLYMAESEGKRSIDLTSLREGKR